MKRSDRDWWGREGQTEGGKEGGAERETGKKKEGVREEGRGNVGDYGVLEK